MPALLAMLEMLWVSLCTMASTTSSRFAAQTNKHLAKSLSRHVLQAECCVCRASAPASSAVRQHMPSVSSGHASVMKCVIGKVNVMLKSDVSVMTLQTCILSTRERRNCRLCLAGFTPESFQTICCCSVSVKSTAGVEWPVTAAELSGGVALLGGLGPRGGQTAGPAGSVSYDSAGGPHQGPGYQCCWHGLGSPPDAAAGPAAAPGQSWRGQVCHAQAQGAVWYQAC